MDTDQDTNETGEKTETVIERLRYGLIVSCPSASSAAYETPDVLKSFVHAAVDGGAAGLRLEGPEMISEASRQFKVPIIGYMRTQFEDGSDLITAELSDMEILFRSGADIVAVDATRRKRQSGKDGFEFIEEARKSFPGLICADVSSFTEGVRAAELGADMIATTLSGCTSYTSRQDFSCPDFELLAELHTSLTIPIIAEGRIWSTEQAAHAIGLGAWSVVVGTAITKPKILTEMFVNAVRAGQTLAAASN
jgi:N-acylglucosamine-6-phosphate 2-epimerase